MGWGKEERMEMYLGKEKDGDGRREKKKSGENTVKRKTVMIVEEN